MFQILGNFIDEIVSRVYEGEPTSGVSKRSNGQPVVEEEVLLCKNNVCVHIQSHNNEQEEHHQPGYFTLKYVHRDSPYPDAILCWIPNSLLAAGITDDESSVTVTAAAEVGSDVHPQVPQDQLVEPQNQKEGEEVFTPKNDKVETEGGGECGAVHEECSYQIQVDHVSSDLQDGSKASRDFHLESNPPSMKCPASQYEPNPSPLKRAESFDTPYGDVFCINLQEMKALKLFFTNQECTCGHFVVGNYDNQYKVFHFHHNGMDKLSEIFNKWEGCSADHTMDPIDTGQKIYYIRKTKEMKSPGKNKKEDDVDGFAEEGHYQPMNLSTWRSYLNPLGQIEDVNNFRKHVFFGGLSPEIRRDAWKFLLYCYPVQSTSFERDGPLKKEKEDGYKALECRRLALMGEDYEKFWRDVQFTVDKDVVRTDRNNPFFSGQDNPNVQKIRNILLNYAIYNPVMGYTQGMSDLVAPLLMVIRDEVDTFWSFVGLMEFSMFATTPTDNSMEKSLGFLKELLRLIFPEFYIHCLLQDEELSLLFCHRWLVLCFKREFIEPEMLTVWETCWSRYQTDYFHIFIAVAILCLYGKKCIEKSMPLDKMLAYFSDLAMKFDGSAVLKKARSILFKFRRLQAIPCTLEGLLSGPGIWDGGIAPEIECISHHRRCCFDKKSVFDDPIDGTTQEMGNLGVQKVGDVKVDSEEKLEIENEVKLEAENEGKLEVANEGKLEVENEGNLEVENDGKLEVQNEENLEIENEGKLEVENEGNLEVENAGKSEVQNEGKLEVQNAGKSEAQNAGKSEAQNERHSQVQNEGQMPVQNEENLEVQSENKVGETSAVSNEVEAIDNTEKEKRLEVQSDGAERTESIGSSLQSEDDCSNLVLETVGKTEE